MTARDLRDTLVSLDGRLDDVRREQVWRTIDRELDEPAPAGTPWWRWRFAIAALGVAVAAGLAMAGLRPGSTPPRVHPTSSTELVAAAGQKTLFERDGATLTLVGPGAASVAQERDGTLRIRVTGGTLLAERTDSAPPLAIAAGSNTTVTRDRTFAVHVSPTTVVLGAGAAATQIIERHVVPDAPPITVEPIGPTRAPPSPPSAAPPAVIEAPARPTTPVAAPDVPAFRAPPTLPDIKFDAPELYKRAEAALAIHDANGASDYLERLLREYPEHALVDAARYDLALIALAAGERAKARGLVDEILRSGRDAAVRAAATTLRAKIE